MANGELYMGWRKILNPYIRYKTKQLLQKSTFNPKDIVGLEGGVLNYLSPDIFGEKVASISPTVSLGKRTTGSVVLPSECLPGYLSGKKLIVSQQGTLNDEAYDIYCRCVAYWHQAAIDTEGFEIGLMNAYVNMIRAQYPEGVSRELKQIARHVHWCEKPWYRMLALSGEL